MKKGLLILISALYTLTCFGWGQKGHDAVAYIAECNLTPKAYKKVVKALGDHSLVYYANWMDNASNTEQVIQQRITAKKRFSLIQVYIAVPANTPFKALNTAK